MAIFRKRAKSSVEHGRRHGASQELGEEMMGRFTTEEWRLVLAFPFHVAVMAASGGGEDELSDKEKKELRKRVVMTAKAGLDPLHKQACSEYRSELRSVRGNGVTPLEHCMNVSEAGPTRVRMILTGKLSNEEYNRFLESVFIDAVNICKADGLSQKEVEALTTMAAVYDLDLNLSSFRR